LLIFAKNLTNKRLNYLYIIIEELAKLLFRIFLILKEVYIVI